jgi:hypothetical protein
VAGLGTVQCRNTIVIDGTDQSAGSLYRCRFPFSDAFGALYRPSVTLRICRRDIGATCFAQIASTIVQPNPPPSRLSVVK